MKGYVLPDAGTDFRGGQVVVFDWHRKYRDGGLAALSTKFTSGRPTVLSDQDIIRLRTMLVGSDPRQYSFGLALWTRKLVAELIEKEFGVRLTLPTVGRILKKLGMSPQRPHYWAYQQDPERVRTLEGADLPGDQGAGRPGAGVSSSLTVALRRVRG